MVQFKDDAIPFVVWIERHEPKDNLVAKNATEILEGSPVIGHPCVECVVIVVSLLTELNGSVLAADEVQVEDEEQSDYEVENTSQDVGCHYHV